MINTLNDWIHPVWPVLFSCIVVGIAVYVFKRTWEDRKDETGIDFWFPLGLGAFVTGFGIVISLLIGYGVGSFIGQNCEYKWHSSSKLTLTSLRNSDGVEGRMSGSLFLMSGYVGSQEVYYFYEDMGDNTFRPHKWYADGNTYVMEEDRKNGEVEYFDLKFSKGDWLTWFAIPRDTLRADFHIPKGSLKKAYALQ